MKKDELLSVCRRQETLLEEARQLLSEKQRLLEQLLSGASTNEAAIQELRETNSLLAHENGELRERCAELRDSLDVLERQSATGIERLNEAWRTSCATWAAEWSERWNVLSERLRTFEAASRNSSDGSSSNWPDWNGNARPRPSDPPADPADCEKIVSEFVVGLMNDLEKTLAG